jgi:hypothetical protein
MLVHLNASAIDAAPFLRLFRRGFQFRKIDSWAEAEDAASVAAMDGGMRAWSDDLPGLSLACPNPQAIFAELTPTIIDLLRQRGFDSKIVRESISSLLNWSRLKNADGSGCGQVPLSDEMLGSCRFRAKSPTRWEHYPGGLGWT